MTLLDVNTMNVEIEKAKETLTEAERMVEQKRGELAAFIKVRMHLKVEAETREADEQKEQSLNSKILERLRSLDRICEKQCEDGTWNYHPYNHGMANGLLLAVATLKEGDVGAVLLSAPDEWLSTKADVLVTDTIERAKSVLSGECVMPTMEACMSDVSKRYGNLEEKLVSPPQLTIEELNKKMYDPRYWKDRNPEFIAEVTKGFKELFPSVDGVESMREPE